MATYLDVYQQLSIRIAVKVRRRCVSCLGGKYRLQCVFILLIQALRDGNVLQKGNLDRSCIKSAMDWHANDLISTSWMPPLEDAIVRLMVCSEGVGHNLELMIVSGHSILY